MQTFAFRIRLDRPYFLGFFWILSFSLPWIFLPKAFSIENETAQKVIVLSIDGLRPDFYMDAKIPTPQFQKWAFAHWFSPGALSVFPSNTYPAHATIATGVRPAVHGIHENRLLDPKSGPSHEWHWFEKDLMSAPLWKIAKAARKKVAVLRWPTSVGARVDWILPEIFGPDLQPKRDWEIAKSHTDPEFLKKLWPETRLRHLKGVESIEQYDFLTIDAMRYLIKREGPDLIYAHLVELDFLQHQYGRKSAPLTAALKKLDSLLGDLFATPEFEKYTLIVVGDHGFSDIKTWIHLNTIFVKKGWIQLSPAGDRIVSWKVIAQPAGGVSAIYVKNPELKEAALSEVRKNSTHLYRVIHKEKIDEWEAFPQAAFAVEAYPGKAFDNAWTGPLSTELKNPVGGHGYDPDRKEMAAGLVVGGPKFSSKKNLGEVGLLDVAPTVCKILELECGPMEGKSLY